jgi:hypothetical protein
VSYDEFFVDLQDVHEHLQEDEDHEGIRSQRPRIIKRVNFGIYPVENTQPPCRMGAH